MNKYVYIQKNVNRYPMIMSQSLQYDVDTMIDADAQLYINHKKLWLPQTIEIVSKKGYKKLEDNQSMIRNNEEYLDIQSGQKMPRLEIIGDTMLDSVKFDKHGMIKGINSIRSLLIVPDKEDCDGQYVVKDIIFSGKTIGYIPIGMNKFIRVKKRRKLHVYLLLVFLFLLLITTGLCVYIYFQYPVMLIKEPLATIR